MGMTVDRNRLYEMLDDLIPRVMDDRVDKAIIRRFDEIRDNVLRHHGVPNPEDLGKAIAEFQSEVRSLRFRVESLEARLAEKEED